MTRPEACRCVLFTIETVVLLYMCKQALVSLVGRLLNISLHHISPT